MMEGLHFIHANNISHRDIKVENILVNSAEESMPTKLIDFGFAHLTDTPDQRLTAFCGTPAYMSPQMAARQEYLGPPVDIWATGVLFF
jgi:serine/threonine protein kinase